MNKLYRSRTNKVFAGVCGGLADWLGWSSGFLRLLTVIAALCSFGTVLIIYFIASLIMPKAPHSFYPHHHASHHYHY